MPLSRDKVLKAALELLDEVGLDELTMRRLAAALGVQPGAIYWHFTDKQALVDAMAEAMLEGLTFPRENGPWSAQLAEYARLLLKATTRHRDGARLLSQMLVPGPRMIEGIERMLGILAKGGLEGRLGLWASAVLGSYVTGFCLDVEALKKMEVSGLVSMARTLKQVLDQERYPKLLGMMNELGALAGPKATAERFEFGLKLILDGLKATVKSQSRSGTLDANDKRPGHRPSRRRLRGHK